MKSRFRHFFLGASLVLSCLAPLIVSGQDIPKAAPPPETPAASQAPATSPAATTPAATTPAASTAAPVPEPTPNVEATPSAPSAPTAPSTPPEPELRRIDAPVDESGGTNTGTTTRRNRRSRAASSGSAERVAIGNNVHLAKEESADSVVAVIGSATSEGDVSDAVVSVLGNTTVSGPVGDSVVAVLGNVSVNSRVGGNVVAVMGDVKLGPLADVGGEVVAVGGRVTRDSKAVVRGGVQNVTFMPSFGGSSFNGLHEWFRRCVLLGRPLAFGSGLGWAWGVAFSFLALYVLFALLFRDAIDKGVGTLETNPGSSVIASVMTMFASPVILVLLCLTVVGVILVPFFGLALLIGSLFGKAVMLAWLGRRFTRLMGDSPLNHTAVAVLIGGVFVLGLYVVPFMGFFIYKLIGILGLGVVVNTILIGSRREKAAAAAAARASAATAASAAAAARAATVTPSVIIVPPPAAPNVSSFGVADASAAGAVGGGFSSGFVGGDSAASGAAAETFGSAVPPVAPIPPVVPTNTLPRAGFWIRMGALALDVILVGLIAGFVNSSLPRFVRFELEPPSILLLLAVYGAVMWKLKGTTIGGIVCGLKVTRVDGRDIDWATAIVRSLGCFLSLVVAGLGFIWVVIDDEKQSWHDKIAGTTVVRVPKGMTLV